jgi:SAM-dependent methyltransferase
MDQQTRIRRAHTFNQIAELYDQGRREVPSHVFDDLFSLAAIEPAAASVLEIGCGTGQATLPLARRGCRIVSLEMGANLVRIASRNLAGFPRVTLVNARFEDWSPAGHLFDIVFAANAWHWLDPQICYAKAAIVVKPGGVLAFTKAHHVFPPGFDPFFLEIQATYEEIGLARMTWPPIALEEIPDSREDIERSGHFNNVQITRRLRIEEFTADEYVAMMATASDHRLIEPAKRAHLFDEMRRLIAARPNGRIRKHSLTVLHIARKKESPDQPG